MKIHSSPWGQVDAQSELIPGVYSVMTPSHGGLLLSAERQKQFRAVAPCFEVFDEQYGSQCWLEEDCDCVMAYLAWPDEATDVQLSDAVQMVRTVASWGHSEAKWLPVADWLEDQAGINKRAHNHRLSVLHLWERGGMGSSTQAGVPVDFWTVRFTRPLHIDGKSEARQVVMAYPEQRYYTDDELNERDEFVSELLSQ